jgi:23S rRNA (guanine2445-N2)-methyltransferase / 23S rRNA (guanine2069-N7)-methyltransferase
LPTWSHFILAASSQFERILGQRADRRRKLYNGRIECQYYQFHGPRPGESQKTTCHVSTDEGPSAVDAPNGQSLPVATRHSTTPVFGGLTKAAYRQAEDFRNRLIKRVRHLRRWPKRGITCYRLYERDVPEVPLVVDRYEDRLHIAEFDRPHERTPAEHADWLDLMAQTAAEVVDVPPAHVHLKRRARQRRASQYEKLDSGGETLIAHEGGLRFRLNLTDYIDTGLFLDHRITRAKVRDMSAGKRVLNLFGYTGAFTVYAAAGGAAATTTVDLSRNYLDWAQQNLDLNDLSGPQHRFVRADVMTFVRDLHPDVRFDLAIVDPPTYSNSKSTANDWDIQRDHVVMLNKLARHLTNEGVIVFSTNFRKFKFAADQLVGLATHEISKQTVPEDFRNRRIHRCWLLRSAR